MKDTETKPNIVFIFADDWGWGDLGCHGHPWLKTPHIDRLAGEGVTFANAFAPMAYCTPSRCCMFTGLYPHTNGHRSIWHLLQKHERNLFQDLKEGNSYQLDGCIQANTTIRARE